MGDDSEYDSEDDDDNDEPAAVAVDMEPSRRSSRQPDPDATELTSISHLVKSAFKQKSASIKQKLSRTNSAASGVASDSGAVSQVGHDGWYTEEEGGIAVPAVGLWSVVQCLMGL